MLKSVKNVAVASVLAGVLSSASAFAANTDYEVITEPAMRAPEATQATLLKLAETDARQYAVGDYGVVVWREQGQQEWQQAQVDTSVLLTDVAFADNQQGWAVGHHGVIIHTEDGGETWQRQLDGFDILRLEKAAAEQRLAALEAELEDADEDAAMDLEFEIEDAQFSVDNLTYALEEEGPTKPLLSVYAKDTNTIFVTAAYGQMLRSTDGGANWTLLNTRLDNPNGYHLNAMAADDDYLYVAAESGTFFRSANNGDDWEQVDFPYNGSLFGLHIDDQDQLWVYGLRGNVFVSNDQGDSFEELTSGTQVNLSGAVVTDSGNSVVVGNSGVIATYNQSGALIELVNHVSGDVLTDVLEQPDGSLILVGRGGIHLHHAIALKEQD